MKRIETAVIGAGRWGRHLVRNVRTAADLELSLVCDRDRDCLRALDGIAGCDDAGAVFTTSGIDAVVIATPPPTHAALVRRALEAGLHVLCEKPLAQSTVECLELRRLAVAQDRRLMVDCTPVYLDEVQQAGREVPWAAVRQVSCVRVSAPPARPAVGPLWDLAPHDLAILRFWFGRLPSHWLRHAHSGDGWNLAARYPGGPEIELCVAYAARPERSIVIRTADGVSRTLLQQQESPEPLQAVLEHFARCIRDKTEPLTGAVPALETTLLLATLQP